MPEAAAPVGPLGLDKHLDLLTLRLPDRPLEKRPSESTDMSNAPIREGPARFTSSVASHFGLRAASRPKPRRDKAQSAQACPHWFERGRPGRRQSTLTGIMSADRFDAALGILSFGRCVFRTVVHFDYDDAGENREDLSLAV